MQLNERQKSDYVLIASMSLIGEWNWFSLIYFHILWKRDIESHISTSILALLTGLDLQTTFWERRFKMEDLQLFK